MKDLIKELRKEIQLYYTYCFETYKPECSSGRICNEKFITNIERIFEKYEKEQANKTVYERVLEERDELKEKLDKLYTFIHDKEKFFKISEKQQKLLANQFDYMAGYLSVLYKRLEDFEEQGEK